MLSLYALFAIAYAIAYFCGRPISALLLDDELEKYDMSLTPWFGMGAVVLAFFALSSLGVSVMDASGCFAVCAALANAAAWLKKRKKSPPRANGREAGLTAAVGFVVCSIYGSALLPSGLEISSVGLNGDTASYIGYINALLLSSARDIAANPEGIPGVSIILQNIGGDFRGVAYFYAFFSALCGVDPARSFYMLSAFVMFLCVMAFRPFLGNSDGGEGKTFPALVFFSLCLPILNEFYQSMVFRAFAGQLASFGITVAAFYVEYHISKKDSFDMKSCLALVFLLSYNGVNYIEGLAYPIIPALAYGLAALALRRPNAAAYWRNMAFSATLFAILNFAVIIAFFKVFFLIQTAGAGFRLSMPTFLDLAGAGGAFASLPGGAKIFALALVNALIAVALARRLRREGAVSFISVSCVSCLLLYIILAAKYYRLGEVSSYNAYKAGLSLSFAPTAVLLRLLAGARNPGAPPRKTRVNAAPLSALAMLLALGAFSTWRSIRYFGNETPMAVRDDYAAVGAYAGSARYAGNFIVGIDFRLPQLVAARYAPLGRTFVTGRGGLEGGGERNVSGLRLSPGDIYVTSALTEGAHNTTSHAKSALPSPLFSNTSVQIYAIDESNPLVLYDFDGISHEFKSTPQGYERQVKAPRALYSYAAFARSVVNYSATFRDRAGDKGVKSVSMYLNGTIIGKFDRKGEFLNASANGLLFEPGANDVAFAFEGDVSELSVVNVSIQ